MQHLAGWYESVDQNAVALDIAAMPDEAVTVSGNFVRCPDDLPNLLAAAFVSASTDFTRARVESPTLRQLANFDILPVNRIATPESNPAIAYLGSNPQPLTAGEDISFNTNTNNVGVVDIYGAVWFGDAPVQPVNGEIFTVRATAAITQLVGVWTNGALTFSQDLPVGTYDVVGLRVQAAGLVFGRLVFVGDPFRPGVLGAITAAAIDVPSARYGRGGLLGTFNQRNPPTLDVVGITGTAQEVYLDLIKTG